MRTFLRALAAVIILIFRYALLEPAIERALYTLLRKQAAPPLKAPVAVPGAT